MGSEMCIRDRSRGLHRAQGPPLAERAAARQAREESPAQGHAVGLYVERLSVGRGHPPDLRGFFLFDPNAFALCRSEEFEASLRIGPADVRICFEPRELAQGFGIVSGVW